MGHLSLWDTYLQGTPLFRGHLWSGDTSLQGALRLWSGDTSLQGTPLIRGYLSSGDASLQGTPLFRRPSDQGTPLFRRPSDNFCPFNMLMSSDDWTPPVSCVETLFLRTVPGWVFPGIVVKLEDFWQNSSWRWVFLGIVVILEDFWQNCSWMDFPRNCCHIRGLLTELFLEMGFSRNCCHIRGLLTELFLDGFFLGIVLILGQRKQIVCLLFYDIFKMGR